MGELGGGGAKIQCEVKETGFRLCKHLAWSFKCFSPRTVCQIAADHFQKHSGAVWEAQTSEI